ncbi:MAG: hypothetical protein KBS81_06360 [Spirochaetales bacterium]|nr:hypothetical protein [Candidatus Physcosoma equi]
MKEAMEDEKLAMDFWGRVEQAQQLCGKTSLKDICRKMAVPYQTLANQKTGARLPSLVVAVSLAKELGTTVEWLLYGVNKDARITEDTRLNALMKRIEELSQTEIFALEVRLGVNRTKSAV